MIKANDERAVLGRTVRGFNLFLDDTDFALNTGIQAIGQILPDADPNLQGSENLANTNINKNLFFAANNARLPDDSFVIYHAGIASAFHNRSIPNPANGNVSTGRIFSPIATYNSVWLGLTPVFTRTLEQSTRFVPTGAERTLVSTGGEGGANRDINFFTTSQNGGSINAINSINLDNFYIQAYLGFSQQDADLRTTTIVTDRTRYYPHLSLTGDRTSSDWVWRYYGGIIATDPLRCYIGSDYIHRAHGWIFDLRTVGYNQSDRTHFSHVQGRVTHPFQLGNFGNLTINNYFRYAFDPHSAIDSLNRPDDNIVSTGISLNHKFFSVRFTKFFAALPNTTETRYRVSSTLRPLKKLSLTGYIAPETNADQYGLNAQLRVNSRSLLVFSWAHRSLNFGLDPFDNDITTANNTFSFWFQIDSR